MAIEPYLGDHSRGGVKSQVDDARLLADLNALRAIGAYKSGVHKPTFSEPHLRSLQWLAERLPEAALTAEIDGIGTCSEQVPNRGQGCWRGRTLKARILRVGSMGRLASFMRSKPPA